MTREENLHWLNQEIQTWENECQSKHPIKEALYAARKALEQEPTTKNDLGVDCISRAEVLDLCDSKDPNYEILHLKEDVECLPSVYLMPSVTPQEPILEKDGTLVVTTEHYKNVGRVLVQYGVYGSLFYQD